jgi:hypothetical protein
MRRIPLLPAVLLVGGLAACASGPEEGSYALVQLNDAALPYDHELGCCIYLSGTFDLHSEQYRVSITFQNKQSLAESTLHERGEYSYPGPRLTFAPTAADFPFSLFDGSLTGDTLRVRFGGDGPGAMDQFRAVFVRRAE